MRSPCLSCSLLHKDKKNDVCRTCEKRWAYVESMGGMTHSMPDDMTDMRRSGNHEGVKMGSTVENGGFKPFVPQEMTSAPKTKTCRECGEPKPIDDFSRSAKSTDGYMHICKACHAKTMGKTPVTKSPKRAVGRPVGSGSKKPAGPLKTGATEPTCTPKASTLREKKCRKCGKVKPVDEFFTNTLSKDGHMHICKSCWSAADNRFASDDQSIKIDFTAHMDVLSELKQHAARELRTPEMHALYLLKSTLAPSAEGR